MEPATLYSSMKLPFPIAIIGSGNVATHLYLALKDKGKVIKVNPRKPEGYEKARLIIIAVKDDVVAKVASEISQNIKPSTIVVHTSGSLPIDVLDIKKDGSEIIANRGVIYPLQTFTKGIPLDYGEIPFFIEANTDKALEILTETVKKISPHVQVMNSEKRKNLHLAAVFACNFTNAMVMTAEEILKKSGIDKDCLLPLLRQTVNKLDILSPAEAQTGPAVRNDTKIIENHLQLLESLNLPIAAEIYKSVSKMITDSSKSNECNKL